jgi:hypothetical protein
MGRANKLKKCRIEQGLEKPIGTNYRLLFCRKCGKEHIPIFEARQHIRECWQYPIRDDEPIPDWPIVKVGVTANNEAVYAAIKLASTDSFSIPVILIKQ